MYFKRNPQLKLGLLRRLILPAFSCAALGMVLVIAVIHFDVLTGSSKAISYALCAVIPAALIGGVLLAMRLRRKSPECFAKLGSHKL